MSGPRFTGAGAGFMVMPQLFVAVQPAALVTVSVYVSVTVGLIVAVTAPVFHKKVLVAAER
ncbi:hypothetical protein D3C71_1750050 [compost metagenome]